MERKLFAALVICVAVITQVGIAEDSPATAPVENPGPPTVEELDNKFSELENRVARQLSDQQASFEQRLLATPGRTFLGEVVPSDRFMPPPADPGNLFFNEMKLADVNLGAGSRVAGSDLIFRAALTGNVQMWYDTGVVASGAQFDPSQIAIGGSSAQGAGAFNMVNFNGQLKFDLNMPISDAEQAQAYLETNYFGGDLTVRQAYGRASFAKINVLAGSYWTAWGDEGTIPKSLNSVNGFPAGANTLASVPQLRFAIPSESGWVTTLAVQQPQTGNIALRGAPNNDVPLLRYPDFAGRIRYFDNDFFSVSVGGLVHIMARENVANAEDFATGWGVSGASRFRVGECGALMGGVAGGKGIAGSIFGLAADSLSAGTSSSGNLIALSNYGTYAGYQHEWSDSLLSTVAYGVAQGQGTAASAGKTHTVQNAWANFIYKVNGNFAFGLEYQYGDRDLVNGNSGQDHRVTLVVSVTAGQNNKASGATAVKNLPSAVADTAVRESIRQSVPTDSGVSRFPRM
jgi:hypothetical protein